MPLRLPNINRKSYTAHPESQLKVAVETALFQQPPQAPTTYAYAATITFAPGTLGVAYAAIGALTGGITINFSASNALIGQSFRLFFKQDGVGGRVVTWGTLVVWGTAGAPALTTTLNTETIVDFWFDGTNWVGKLYATGV